MPGCSRCPRRANVGFGVMRRPGMSGKESTRAARALTVRACTVLGRRRFEAIQPRGRSRHRSSTTRLRRARCTSATPPTWSTHDWEGIAGDRDGAFAADAIATGRPTVLDAGTPKSSAAPGATCISRAPSVSAHAAAPLAVRTAGWTPDASHFAGCSETIRGGYPHPGSLAPGHARRGGAYR
jgi:hypothetical protein